MRLPFRRHAWRPLPTCAAAVLLFLLAQPNALGFASGCALVAVGAALRAWGAGHLVKTDQLTTSGPYAYLRHPLYLGTLLVAAGFGLGAGGAAAAYVLPVVLLGFFLYYLPYKDRIEGARLERAFGAPYVAYRAEVPALIPSRRRWSPPGIRERRARWRAERFRDNNEGLTLLCIGLGLCALALRPLMPL